MELISLAQRLKVRENFAKQANRHLQGQEISEANTNDIITYLARYGGRVEVRGLGTFFVVDVPAKPRVVNGLTIVRPARRIVDFKQSTLLRDMLNNDFFSDEVPTPNSDYFVEVRNIML